MVEAIKWLKRCGCGFESRSRPEQKAIKDFGLLWSLFEGTVLNTNANAHTIIQATKALRDRNVLKLVRFKKEIAHFRERYHDGKKFTPKFDALNWKPRDRRDLAEAFISGSAVDDVTILSGLLIIIYRLRNNLFHGIKWSNGIEGQLDNFRHANNILMKVMDLYHAGPIV